MCLRCGPSSGPERRTPALMGTRQLGGRWVARLLTPTADRLSAAVTCASVLRAYQLCIFRQAARERPLASSLQGHGQRFGLWQSTMHESHDAWRSVRVCQQVSWWCRLVVQVGGVRVRQQVKALASLHAKSFRDALCITNCRAVPEAEHGVGRSAGGRTLADSARSRRCVLSRLAPAASSSPSLHTRVLF